MKPDGVEEMTMESVDIEPSEFFVELGMLVLESRLPTPSVKGRQDGPHCPPALGDRTCHSCDANRAQCKRASEMQKQMQTLWRNHIPMCIEVLLHPDCSHGQQKALSSDATPPVVGDGCVLLERWTIQPVVQKKTTEHCISSKALFQAVRSYLHFSQLSAWLNLTHGYEPRHVGYRVSPPAEFCTTSFAEDPESHVFPVAVANKSINIRVTLAHLPRLPAIPKPVCRKRTGKRSCVVDDDDDGRALGIVPPFNRLRSSSPAGGGGRVVVSGLEPPQARSDSPRLQKPNVLGSMTAEERREALASSRCLCSECVGGGCNVRSSPDPVVATTTVPSSRQKSPVDFRPRTPSPSSLDGGTARVASAASKETGAIPKRFSLQLRSIPEDVVTAKHPLSPQDVRSSRIGDDDDEDASMKRRGQSDEVNVRGQLRGNSSNRCHQPLGGPSNCYEMLIPEVLPNGCLWKEGGDSSGSSPDFDYFLSKTLVDQSEPLTLQEMEFYLQHLYQQGGGVETRKDSTESGHAYVPLPKKILQRTRVEPCGTKTSVLKSTRENVDVGVRSRTGPDGDAKDSNSKERFYENSVGNSQICFSCRDKPNEYGEREAENRARSSCASPVADGLDSSRGGEGKFDLEAAPPENGYCDCRPVFTLGGIAEKNGCEHGAKPTGAKSAVLDGCAPPVGDTKSTLLDDRACVQNSADAVLDKCTPVGDSTGAVLDDCTPIAKDSNCAVSDNHRTPTMNSKRAILDDHRTQTTNSKRATLDDRRTPVVVDGRVAVAVHDGCTPMRDVTNARRPSRTEASSSSLVESPQTTLVCARTMHKSVSCPSNRSMKATDVNFAASSSGSNRVNSLLKTVMKKELIAAAAVQQIASSSVQQTASSSAPTPEEEVERWGTGPVVPTSEERTIFRQCVQRSASMVFHAATGLPLQSSPVPAKKMSFSSFDYDSSLHSVRAIKNSLSCINLDAQNDDDDNARIGTGRQTYSTSAPASTNCLLGSFEESLINGRIEPSGVVDGFTVDIGASGSFCPNHITLPVTAFFFTLSDDNAPSPYLGHINLESSSKRGYHIPKQGTVQITLFNPNTTVVKMFVVKYDMSDMPPNHQTFLRQRTLYMPVKGSPSDVPGVMVYLRYLIHLRFASSKTSKIYLHTDIRVIFARDKFELDSRVANYELRSFTDGPENPKFSSKR